MNSTHSMSNTILVVDDTLENLDVLITSMENFGFNFSVARSGEEMFKRLEQVLPSLILLDVRMPGMTGFEACRRLKADERFQRIPVIFMTALAETVDKVKGFDLGAVDYITKPFQQEEVLARLKTHLTIQELQNDLRAKNDALQAALERERTMLEDLRMNISFSLPHELRTPLHAIIGFTGTILDASVLLKPEQLKKYVINIQQNGRRLQRLIENALLYADLKMLRYAGHTEEREQRDEQYPFDISESLEGLGLQAAKENRRERDLELDLIKSRIRVTPKHFNKIVAELLANAFKFSEAGTPVRLTNRQEDEQCLISVSDRGRGMSREQIDMLDAYTQFERRRYEQQGLGLGLVIAQLLSRLEGGKLSIESSPGQGTTCRLSFQVDTHAIGISQAHHIIREQPQESPEDLGDAEMKYPEESSLKALLHLATLGDILELDALLRELETKDSRYRPFVQKSRSMFEDFQFGQLQEFLRDRLR